MEMTTVTHSGFTATSVKGQPSKVLTIGIVTGVVTVLALIATVSYCICYRRKCVSTRDKFSTLHSIWWRIDHFDTNYLLDALANFNICLVYGYIFKRA